MRADEPPFLPCFSAVFTLLGLRMLFGSKPVTLGSVLLLGCVSGVASVAWVGSTGDWVGGCVAQLASLANRTALPTASNVLERIVEYVERAVDAREQEQDEL